MKPQDCPSFDRCDAMLCPLGASVGWLDDAAWFPDEDVCNCQGEKPRWVEVQRRIAEATGKDRKRGFFTLRMLEAITRVTPMIEGIDVDTKDEAADVEAWCAKHTRRIWTEEDKRLVVLRGAKTRFRPRKSRPEETDGQIGISGHVEGALAGSKPMGEKNANSAGGAA